MDSLLHAENLFESNFLEYASYVIKDRAIPELLDGLKPVQRRILHTLAELDDGRFHKVANVIGHCMRYHPHGDAAIGDALVVLANKDYFIDKQGNFGNLFTGDVASASRYIECRLTPLAKEVLFHDALTQWVDSYDGRNKEPVKLPCKIPYLLLHGAEGIAVGMSTKILPHNFNEVLEAQIAYLQDHEFKLYPDFPQGGLMDPSEYDDGRGKVRVRAKIDAINNKTLHIKELPFGITTESLLNSVEDAIRKNRIKVTSIRDYTAEHVELELQTQKGVYSEEVLPRLFAYTDCEVSVSSNIIAIDSGLPHILTVSEIIRRSTDELVEILKKEINHRLGLLNDQVFKKSLEQIFIENKHYKKLETSEDLLSAKAEILKVLKKYEESLNREIVAEDIDKLIEIPIRRIAKFDIDKNQKDLLELREKIESENKNLAKIKQYTISFLKDLIKKYGKLYPRKTQITNFDSIHAKDLNDIDTKVYYDKVSGFIGTKVKGDQRLDCSSFDKLLLVSAKGSFSVVPIPEKLFCEKLLFFGVVNKDQIFSVLSKDKKNKAAYVKRFKVEKFLQNKEYVFLDKGHKLESLLTDNDNSKKVELVFDHIQKGLPDKEVLSLDSIPVKLATNKGLKISVRQVSRAKFI